MKGNDLMKENMEPLIQEIAAGSLETKFGKFRIYYFFDGKDDAVALVKGEGILGEKNVLCRIHSQCFLAEAFFSIECDCSKQLESALKAIQEQGGILIYLFQNGRGYGLAPLISTQDLKERGMNQQEAFMYKGFYGIERSFDIAAKILLYFNIKSIKLMTKNKSKVVGMKKYGIAVNDSGLSSPVVIFDRNIKNQIHYNNIEVMPITDKTVIIISDLNVDEIMYLQDGIGDFHGFDKMREIRTGGCAFNAACIFKEEKLDPIIIGSVGNDPDGKLILEDLEKHNLKAFIYLSDRPTGKSGILYRKDSREIQSQPQNANEYDLKISTIMDSMSLREENLVYITTHILFRSDKENISAIINSIYKSRAKIVVDIVPHDIYTYITWDSLCQTFNMTLFMLICELKTFILLNPELNYTIGNEEQIEDQIFEEVLEKLYASNLDMEYLVLRYGYENIGKQRVYKKIGGKFNLYMDEETGFRKIQIDKRRGYGEILTAKLLKKLLLWGE